MTPQLAAQKRVIGRTEITLTHDTPAELLGLRVVIRAGQTLIWGPEDVRTAARTFWAPSTDGAGPAALCPIHIHASLIR